MAQIQVTGVARDTVRPHPTKEGAVLVSAGLLPAPDNMWQARFSQSLLRSSDFGRFEMGRDGSSVEITVGRDEEIAERLAQLATIVEQTNADVAEEQQRLGAEQGQQQAQDDHVAK